MNEIWTPIANKSQAKCQDPASPLGCEFSFSRDASNFCLSNAVQEIYSNNTKIAGMESVKPVHTLVLDAGAIIRNEPSVSSLLKHCESLVTVPSIISEIKDAAARSRLETMLLPFLTLRSPSPTSIRFVTEFARKTGDLAVLSKPDLHIIALTYEIECERNGGDWRLRRVPGQRRLNGAPPSKEESAPSQIAIEEESTGKDSPVLEAEKLEPTANEPVSTQMNVHEEDEASTTLEHDLSSSGQQVSTKEAEISSRRAQTSLTTEEPSKFTPKVDSAQNSSESQADSDSDSEGWITPSNLKKKQAEDAGTATEQTPEPKTMQVAVLTTDFAMQNVILQMNLNLLSPSLTRVKHLKTFVLRCHACFQVTKEMSKQFCPRCGQPALTRVSCSTNSNGEFKVHLKKNMQWNSRGDKYSIPKPVHGSAHGRVKGGGKGGWGSELILAEDQKEYQRAVTSEKKQKARDLMDEDYLPSILTGDRGKTGGRIKVGAGRNVNSRKR